MSVGVALRSEGSAGARTIDLATIARIAAVVTLGALMVALEVRLRGDADIWTQVAGQLVAFVLFVPAAFVCWRGLRIGIAGVVLVLAFAVSFRAAAFEPGASPPLSTDVHRYAWDARVQANGINPYRYTPSAEALRPLRDDAVWARINLPAWHTVYPPGAEASFLAARGIFGDGLRATTWLCLVGEAAVAGLLLLVLSRLPSRPPLERVALYAWHPLAISEIAANGHVDALAVVALAALLAVWQARRFVLAGVAVALAALVKLGPILLVPALSRRGGWRLVLPALAVCALAYVPYLSVGAGVFGDLRDYVERQRFGGSLWWVLEPHLGEDAATAACGVLLLAVVGVVALRQHDSVEQAARSCLLVLGTLLLTVSYVQPWHALWLLPFAVVVPAPGWLWLTGTLPLLYLFGLEHGFDRELPDWIRLVVYGGFALFVVWRVAPGRRRRPDALAALPRARVAAVIPALNEAQALPAVLAEVPRGAVDEVVVVDGGSEDGTAARARAAGARVVVQARRGYGRACATGAAAADADVIVFLDGDGSDDPRAIPLLVAPILEGRAALVLGARTQRERGALRLHQRLGNRLVALLVRLVYRVPVRDVPPMRAIRRDALVRLELREMTYGWPTEMLVKAARANLAIAELAVPSRARRGGASKVSGRMLPSVKAGALMLAVVARYA